MHMLHVTLGVFISAWGAAPKFIPILLVLLAGRLAGNAGL